MEEQLRDGERRYRELIEALGVAVYTTDAEGRITLYNDAAAGLWGRQPELGRELWCGSWRLYWPDGRPMPHEECPLAITLKENRPVRGLEAVAERPDGTRVTFLPYPTPLRDASGTLIGAVNVLVDVTDRKKTEDDLRESESRNRLAMDAARMGSWEWSVRTGEVRWSEGLELIHGLAPGTFEGTFEAFRREIHPEDRDLVAARIEQALKEGSHDIEYRIVTSNGDVRWVAGKGQVLYDDVGEPVRMIGVCMDVTERKRSAGRQQLLADAGTVLGSSLDYDTVLERLANMIVEQIADWAVIDILNEDGSVRRLGLAYADPQHHDAARRLEQYIPDPSRTQRLQENLARGESMLFPELSDQQLASASLDQTQYEIMRGLGFKSAMIVPLRARSRLLGAITFVSAASGRRYNADDLDLANELANRAALAVDNARLFGESQQTQDELRKANEAKDEFLGLVSHELRTPITTIYGGVRLLRSRAETLDEESRSEVLQDIETETERLHRLVENLLVLARLELGEQVELEPVALSRVIDRVLKVYSERSPSRPLTWKVDDGLQAVAGEPTYLEQVLRNLLSNADKYSPPGTPIEVYGKVYDGEAVVRVLDRGSGIRPEEAESVFDRFYRSPDSKQKARGMGLGLTVCRRLIEAQSGRIWAKPRTEGGLEVGFAVPLYKDGSNEQ